MDQGLSFKLLLATEDIDDFLRGLGRLAVALRSDDTSYGISLRRDHRPMTATTIDARASHVDEIQPGHQMSQPRTLQTGDMVVVRDLARWGGCQMSALGHGPCHRLDRQAVGRTARRLRN